MATRNVGPAQWASQASVKLTLALSVNGSTYGNLAVDIPAIQIDFSAFSVQPIDLASGNNTISLPVSATNQKATACIMIPPAGNATLWKHRKSGDTEDNSNAEMWAIRTFDTGTPPVSFQINAAADITGFTLIWL